MITVRQVLSMFRVLEANGLRAPDMYAQPATPDEPSGRAFAASVYVAAFNLGGYTWAEVERATLEYALEPQEGQYPKPWPSPGHIAARTAMGRVQMHLGTDADADAALSDFARRMAALVSRGGPSMADRNQHLDADPHRNAAMFAALDAVGGARAWGEKPADDRTIPHRWRVAYMDERKRQAQSPRSVRLMVVSVARQIGASS